MGGASEILWYIPNDTKAGHRGDIASADHNSLATLTSHAKALEQNGWKGALIGTGWGRPDTFTVATALAAQTSTFEPLAAIRPGYWQPAHFASAAATLDELSGGRLRINIVSGRDDFAAYGDSEGDQAQRYARTKEFMRLVRRLWTEQNVNFHGKHFQLSNSTAQPRITKREGRPHPKLTLAVPRMLRNRSRQRKRMFSFSGAKPLQSIKDRIERLKAQQTAGPRFAPLEFGLRITTVVRSTTAEAWRDAEDRVAEMAKGSGARWNDHLQSVAVGSSDYTICNNKVMCSTITFIQRRDASAAAEPRPPGSSGRR